jgi:hypothetical protein
VVDDLRTLDRACYIVGIEHGPGHELDVETFERSRPRTRLENAYLMAILQQLPDQDVAEASTTTGDCGKHAAE